MHNVEGVEVKLWQVAETLPEEILTKMGASPKGDVPIITPKSRKSFMHGKAQPWSA